MSAARSGTVGIRLGLGTYLRLFVFAVLVGGLLGVLATAGIVGSALDLLARLEAPGDPYAYAPASDRDTAIFAVLPVLFLAVVVLPMVCLRLRSGGPMRITWDDEGVAEWEGETVRTFIPRATARIASDERIRTRYRRGRRYTYEVAHVVQVSDDSGRRITLAWRAPLRAIGFGALPLWMRRRPVVTSWGAIEPLLEAFPASSPPPPIVPDERGARRPLGVLSTVLHLFAVALGGFALYAITAQRSASDVAGAALIAAGLCFALAIVRPLGECFAIARASRSVAGAQPVSFRVGPDGGLSVVLGDGRALAADVSALRHPDAHVYRREAPVRAVLEISGGSGDAYRGAPGRAVVRAVDTGAERAERRRILIADVLEIAGRAAHALLVITIGVLIVTGVQGF